MNLADKIIAFLTAGAVLSAGLIALGVVNAYQGIQTVRGVEVRLQNLVLDEDEDTHVAVTFRIENGSAAAIRLKSFDFSLFLNGNFMGSNYDPVPEKVIGGSEKVTMNFVVPMSPFYLRRIEEARERADLSWSVRGEAVFLLPSLNDRERRVRIQEIWSGSQ